MAWPHLYLRGEIAKATIQLGAIKQVNLKHKVSI